MKFLVVLAIGLMVGFLVVVPVVGFLVTRNDVEREFDGAMVEYQTIGRERLRQRLQTIAAENQLDPATLRITVDDSGSACEASIAYSTEFRVLFVPVHRDVAFTRRTTKLGI
jgi:hypothetical protein